MFYSNRFGYMSLQRVHFCLYKDIRQFSQGLTLCSCIICFGKESMLCVCGCDNYCLLREWISTCPGLCTVRVLNQNTNWYSIRQLFNYRLLSCYSNKDCGCSLTRVASHSTIHHTRKRTTSLLLSSSLPSANYWEEATTQPLLRSKSGSLSTV